MCPCGIILTSTSMYLIDNVTGEIYACHQDEIIAIKEQGYL